jgi:hypothetical protein
LHWNTHSRVELGRVEATARHFFSHMDAASAALCPSFD